MSSIETFADRKRWCGSRSTLYHGDALAILRDLDADTVDCLVTDPPYASSGSSASVNTASARSKYVQSGAKHTLPDFGGEARDQRSYTAWLSLILSEGLRVTRPGGSCLVFTDWRQLPATSDALQVAGWRWQGIIAWHKPNVRPIKGFKRSCEYVLWGTNGRYDHDANPVYLNGWHSESMPAIGIRQHITQKPIGLMDHLLQICPADGHVLDPFAGSASTGVSAIASGRTFTGIELSEDYWTVATNRLAEAEDSWNAAQEDALADLETEDALTGEDVSDLDAFDAP